ncbi:MAG: TonB-dependent receptor [Gemmatimonadales bacterium]
MRTLLMASAGLGLLVAPLTLPAQDSLRIRSHRDSIVEMTPVTVTATRTPHRVFTTPAPVSVVDSVQLARRAPGNVADLFLDLPGLDLSGVGPSQARPIIRGQLGQRILLLEDGIRMNNTRRQQDFGEIPAIVALETVGQVEVVRGPASVLYGTDAIGGAVNLITRQPPPAGGVSQLHGTVGYRYQGAGGQQRPWALLSGASGRFNFLAFGSYRDAGAYIAPPGTFGGQPLASGTRVRDTGVRDQNYAAQLGVALSESQNLRVRYERYTARDAGFGFVDNTALGTLGAPTIKITYPDQGVDKLTLGYRASALHSVLADRLDVTTYYQRNARHLDFDIFVPFGPGTPPGAGLVATTRNFTDLGTWGFRVEAAKAVAIRHVLTYGIDGFRDGSTNTDSITQTIVGFGPPSSTTSTTPQLPNANLRSVGAFAQMELGVTPRLTVIAGVRGQDTRSATRTTPGITAPNVTSTDRTIVGSLNASYALDANVTLVGTMGRGFRSPNLVERFFTGPIPEVGGYQKQTPNLHPETSLNTDIGVRVRARGVTLEIFGFRNQISGGIAIEATGDTVQGLAEFQNVNVNRLRTLGLEAAGELAFGAGFSTAANFTVFDTKDVLNPRNPVGQSYATRVGGSLRYEQRTGRFWLAYDVRHYGEQKDVVIASRVGSPTPSFTIQDARAGARLFEAAGTRHSVSFTVANLANKLYSEAANTSFFRPAPGRNVMLSYRMDF